MVLTNTEIFNYIGGLNSLLMDETIKFPVKVNFLIQKNISALLPIYELIEKTRTSIANKYGAPSEEDSNIFSIYPECYEQASSEINELMEVPNEVDINLITLDSIESVSLSFKQMQALMFMIKEEG